MTTASIILLISVLGIVAMVGRKLALVRREEAIMEAALENPFLPDIEKVKFLARKKARRYGYVALFAVLRLYIHTANLLKKKSIELARKIEAKLLSSKDGLVEESHEVSRYLKMISEYQQKVRRMKKKIKEEDGIE